VGIAEGGLLATAIERALASAREFVIDQARDQIDGRHSLGLGLTEPGFQNGGYAAEPELT
jgi:hypothetical protein